MLTRILKAALLATEWTWFSSKGKSCLLGSRFIKA